jgi:alpha-tubulin suppressor-like RCC1 family protein
MKHSLNSSTQSFVHTMPYPGILFLSDVGNILDPSQEPPPLPLLISQCDELLGKKFFSISSTGENIIVNCRDGSYLIDTMNTITGTGSGVMLNISSGKGFSVGLTDQGQLFSWGIAGDVGQLGHGAHLKKIFQPLQIDYKTKFVSVASGESFSMALDEVGHAYAWGAVSACRFYDLFGQNIGKSKWL